MTIGDIEIPDSEIEKLAPSKKKVLHCLYQAYQDGGAVTTWTLALAGGTGFSMRIKNCKDEILHKYGITIRNKEYIRREGRSVHAYWLAPIDKLPIMPRKVFGNV